MNYKDTVFLPRTNFPMRGGLPLKEPQILKNWRDIDIYKKLRDTRKGAPIFVLHDGPPYANGKLHIGHALNKILKDVVNRSQSMLGKNANYVPGWDCHGLPIEWKIEEQYRKKGMDKDIVPVTEFRQECRDFASHWLGVQSDEFQRLGVLGDWAAPYTTMAYSAEAKIAEELGKILMDGSLYRGTKPVMWSPVEKTALAEAEIEYEDHTSVTIYARFPVKKASHPALEGASIIIWTTTPWTMPGNRAVAYGDDISYQIVEVVESNEGSLCEKGDVLVIANDLAHTVIKEIGVGEIAPRASLMGCEMAGTVTAHPMADHGYDYEVPLLAGSHVTTEQGTGFVHIAPNHGVEDFDVGVKNDLDNTPTVEGGGTYTSNVPFFNGIHVFKADEVVINELKNQDNLVSCSDYFHSYPHSWRSKAPLIYRATSQWFISLDKKNLRDNALHEIEKVEWIPKNSKNRIKSMVQERPDWCVSRQRSWGVPITIFISKKTGEPLVNKEINSRILSVIQKEGIDSWFVRPKEFFLENVKNHNEFEKVDSILDVWFDSGSSHVYVLKNNGINEKADLYLEGSDQHRGWFQSSLIESCANYGVSPFKSVLTHGFVIDEKGKKMSKSLGNVISPEDVIKKYGADILRIWVANSNFNEDIKISYQNLDRQAESYRKIRNTIRFILGNLNDFSSQTKIDHEKLFPLEKFIRHKLYVLNNEINIAYENFNFIKAFQMILGFCSQELSALFFDIRKDALYCEKKKSLIVRSTKTVMADVFQCLIRWLAPIIPFTSEEAWQCWREEVDKNQILSCHLLNNIKISEKWYNKALEEEWTKILEIKNAFTFAVEQKRNLKEIKSSLEAKAHIYFKDSEYQKVCNSQNLSEILISSDIKISESYDDKFLFNSEGKEIGVKIFKEDGEKCPRCWKIFNKTKEVEELCKRCQSVIDEN
mgnify:CR=1 FL=1